MRFFTSLVTEIGRDFIPGDTADVQKKGLCFCQIETESTEDLRSHIQHLGYLAVIIERPQFFYFYFF